VKTPDRPIQGLRARGSETADHPDRCLAST